MTRSGLQFEVAYWLAMTPCGAEQLTAAHCPNRQTLDPTVCSSTDPPMPQPATLGPSPRNVLQQRLTHDLWVTSPRPYYYATICPLCVECTAVISLTLFVVPRSPLSFISSTHWYASWLRSYLICVKKLINIILWISVSPQLCLHHRFFCYVCFFNP